MLTACALIIGLVIGCKVGCTSYEYKLLRDADYLEYMTKKAEKKRNKVHK